MYVARWSHTPTPTGSVSTTASSTGSTVPMHRPLKSKGPTCAWWLIPLSKWVITPVINGISRVNPLITGVITHLLSGMSHQVKSSSTLMFASKSSHRPFSSASLNGGSCHKVCPAKMGRTMVDCFMCEKLSI